MLRLLAITLFIVSMTYFCHLNIKYFKESKGRPKIHIQPIPQNKRLPYTIPDQFPMSSFPNRPEVSFVADTNLGKIEQFEPQPSTSAHIQPIAQKEKIPYTIPDQFPTALLQAPPEVSVVSETNSGSVEKFEPQPSTSAQAMKELRLQKQKENFIVQIDGEALDLQQLTARLLAIKELNFVLEEDWMMITTMVDREEIYFESEAKTLLIDLSNSDLSLLQPNDWDSIKALDELEASIYTMKYDQSGLLSFSKTSKPKKSKCLTKSIVIIEQNDEQDNQIEVIESVVLQVDPMAAAEDVQCLPKLQQMIKLNTQRFNPDVTTTKFDLLMFLTGIFLITLVAVWSGNNVSQNLSLTTVFCAGFVSPCLICILNDRLGKFVLDYFCPNVIDYNL